MTEGLMPIKTYPRSGTLGIVDLLWEYVAACSSIERTRREIFAFPDIRKVEKEFPEMVRLCGPTSVIAIDIEPEKAIVVHQSPIQIFTEQYDEMIERLTKQYLDSGGRKSTVTRFNALDPKRILLRLAYPCPSKLIPTDSAKRMYTLGMVLAKTYWGTMMPLGDYGPEAIVRLNENANSIQNIFTVKSDCLDHEVLLGTETISPSRLKLVNL